MGGHPSSFYFRMDAHPQKCQIITNVISKRYIYLDENPEKLIIHKIVSPELHLMMAVVGVLGQVLFFLGEPGFKTWLITELDGMEITPAKYLDYLEQDVIKETPIYQYLILTVIKCLPVFKSVKDAAFGKDLKPEFETIINNFVEILKSLQNNIHNEIIEGLTLSTT